jgi:hypothetical protein
MRAIRLIRTLTLVLILSIGVRAVAQSAVDNEITLFYSYGVAGEDQMLPDTLPGVYDEQKNGYYGSATVDFSGSVTNRYDFYMRLAARSRVGSPYLGMQLSPATPTDFSVSLDTVYARLLLGDIFFSDFEILGADVGMALKVGKFALAAPGNSVSRFGLESAVGMLKTSNSGTVDLVTTLEFPDISQTYDGKRSSLSLEMASGGLIDEAIQRLYDTDGSISNHGKPVIGEFAPQLFGQLVLDGYVLPFGILSAAAGYAYNGAGIYSGHSTGASSQLAIQFESGTLQVPVSAGFSFHEKNIDVLGAATGNTLDIDTTDFRHTMRAGVAVGLQYSPRMIGVLGAQRVVGDLSLSGSFTNVRHIYRDPVSVFGLALDGQYLLTRNIYVGGGAVLGTLGNVTWQTRADVPPVLDDYSHTFTLAQNFGYEAYVGVDVLDSARVSIGFVNMRGLALNYGLESIQSGLVKYRQPGTAISDELWETMGVYILTSVRL